MRKYPRFLVVGIIVLAIELVTTSAANAKTQVPPELAGTWAIQGPNGGTQFLTLSDSRFRFFSPDFPDVPSRGAVSVSGNLITFYSSNRCNGTGTYEWTLDGGGLTFVQAAGSNDPCSRAAFLTFGTWTRS